MTAWQELKRPLVRELEGRCKQLAEGYIEQNKNGNVDETVKKHRRIIQTDTQLTVTDNIGHNKGNIKAV